MSHVLNGNLPSAPQSNICKPSAMASWRLPNMRHCAMVITTSVSPALTEALMRINGIDRASAEAAFAKWWV